MRLGARLLGFFGRDPRKFGRNGDIDLLEILAQGEFPVHARLDVRPVRQLRSQATDCHASQLDGGTPRRGFWSWLMSYYNRYEYFMRAVPEPKNGLLERDLFEGL